MQSRVEAMRTILASHRQQGIMPGEIHASAATCRDFAREAGIKPQRKPDTRSMLERIRGAGDEPETVLAFDNVPLVENDAIPSPMIIVRPAQLMGDPNWLANVQFKNAEQEKFQRKAGDLPPWHQRVEEGSESVEDTSLESLSRGGGVNPTTCIMKAMEGLDAIEDVIVLRFYKNKNIDLCSTLNQFGVVGALQKALGHVMNCDD